jgi:hypothetical protein
MPNYAAKFDPKVAERFTQQSYTKGVASNAYSFEGVRIVKIYSEDTFAFANYTRSGSDRYGTVHDQTDSIQELEMTQDKGVSIVIDKGENIEKMNTQGANRQLKREIDEQAIPMFDKYCFGVWAKNAGNVVPYTTAPNVNTMITNVLDMTEKLDESFVPESGRTLWVTSNGYKLIKENPQFIYTDKLAQNTLVRGQVGELDGFKVVKVASQYFPAGVDAIAAHKGSILNPMKLQDYNLHHNPPGVSGDRIDIRLMYDAYVLDAKAGGVCVLANNANVAAAPTLSYNGTSKVAGVAFTGSKAWYTLDGSDPRCSGTAVEINANAASINANGAVGPLRAVVYDGNKAVAYRSNSLALE